MRSYLISDWQSLASGASDSTATLEITDEKVLIGTVQYMAPEQLEGKDADARSDIFAFGLVLYEMSLDAERSQAALSPV